MVKQALNGIRALSKRCLSLIYIFISLITKKQKIMAAQRVVTLNADGIAEREIMYVRYELNQQTDVEGQPTGTTRGGKIYFKVKSNDDGNTDLLEWMCDTYMSKSGTISWPNRQGGEMKHLDFKEGYMVEYAETYDNKNEVQQYEEFTISAKEIQVGNARHNNRWTIDNN